MTALSISHLWKEYGDQIVLEDVSIDIAPRSFVALVGPSGCGKTTFLRLLLGQEVPTRGRILIDGQPLPPEPGPDRGVVYQRYSVFPHLTVLRNVMLGPEMRASRFLGRRFGAARRALADEACAMLAEVGLAGSEQKYPAQLSGGMQQRLALAQTLTMRPPPPAAPTLPEGMIHLAVVGAHLSGMQQNDELTGPGGVLLEETRTAPGYRLYALSGTVPPKPGMIMDPGHDGPGISVEIWALPSAAFGAFAARIPAPLGLGKVRLADGREVTGFLCESHALAGAEEITAYGGWRAWRAARAG